MRRHSWTLVTLLILGLFTPTGPALPQSPPADAVAAAKELVVTMRMSDQMKAIVPMFMQQLRPLIVQGRPLAERDFDKVVPLVVETMTDHFDKFAAAVAAIYAINFTADEIRQITAFYLTPAGQKLLERQPAIAQQSLILGQRFGNAIQGDLRQRIIEELRKRGHDL